MVPARFDWGLAAGRGWRGGDVGVCAFFLWKWAEVGAGFGAEIFFERMNIIDTLLHNELFALFAIIGVGFLIGKITIAGMNLGSSGVLFAALVAGHFGYGIPGSVGNVGLVLFVYCVGIGAGARFFSSLAREGASLAQLAVVVVGSGALVAWGLGKLMGLPAGLASGIFAGAMTSTPALAAASESLQAGGADAVIIGYGVAYPFGVIGVVLFVQLAPRLMRVNLEKAAAESAKVADEENRVENVLVEVSNPNLAGKSIAESALSSFGGVMVSRVLHEGGQLVPLKYGDVFEMGQNLLLVGRTKEVGFAVEYVGRLSDKEYHKDVENERQVILVTAKEVSGRTLSELALLKNHGVVVTRVTRLGLTFIPSGKTRIERNDQLLCVGLPEDLKKFSVVAGHRTQGFEETDLLSLGIGLALGVIVGLIPLSFPGSTSSITLGLAGGPLLVALLLGHFGRVGQIVGYIPRNTRLMLQELGLVFFLADAGVKGGAKLVSTVGEYGIPIFLVGLAVTIVPLAVGLPFAMKVQKMDVLRALGGLCGGMTSTPALGALTSRTDSQVPVVSYASAYPIALILMTVFAKLLIGLMGG